MSALPAGPRLPKTLQMIGWWARPTAFIERCRRRYGRRFTLRMLAQAPFVVVSDPDEIKQVFTAPPDVLHPGEGARILEPIIGPNSVILLDGAEHVRQRRLVLPAFHGDRMEGLSGIVTGIAREQIAAWPWGEPIALHPRLQRLTMEVILAAVFGLRAGERQSALREVLVEMLSFGLSPVSVLPPAQRAPLGLGPWARFTAARERADELIYAEIGERRERGGGGEAIIDTFVAATHEDGTPMSDEEVRDELLTLLVAGHETTATELSFALERLTRQPAALERLADELDSGDGEAYLTATIRETLRRRPVLSNAAPRTVKQPVEIGGITYPRGVHLIASAWLVHHDAEIYPDPYAFRPERFLDSDPGTYTWIPFGGGRRRCAGASFAMLEMGIVLRELLASTGVRAVDGKMELQRRRGITVTPGRGAEVVLSDRASSQPRPSHPATSQPDPHPSTVG